MANTESLVVELNADTKQIDKKLKNTNKALNNLGDAANDTDGKFSKFSITAGAVGKAITAMGAAIGVATVAAISFGKAIGDNEKELKNQARLAGVTVKEFRELAFIYGTVGLSAEKFGDQSKDAAEKVGEFATELAKSGKGAGGLMDFMDVMNFTEQQIKDTTAAMEQMNSDQILQFMVSQMESAGVSAKRMSFALEGVASDATALIPLLLNNGKAAKELKEQFQGINNELSDEEKQNYIDFAKNMTLVETSFKSFMSNALAPFIPQMNEATKAVAEFFAEWNTELDIDRIGESIKQGDFGSLLGDIDTDKEAEAFQAKLNTLVSEQGQSIIDAQNALDKFEEVGGLALGRGMSQEEIDAKKAELQARLEAEQSYLEQVTEAYAEFNEQQSEIEQASIEEAEGQTKLEKQQQEQSELLDDYASWQELGAEIDQEDFDRREELRQLEFMSTEEYNKQMVDIKKRSTSAQMKLDQSVYSNAVGLLKTLGGENKAFALIALGIQKATALSANATATASGSMLAYASQLIPGDPTSIARAEAARDYTVGLGAVNAGLIVATGLAEAGGVMSGGSSGSFGGSGGGDTTQSNQQADFEQETTDLELTESTAGGSNVTQYAIDAGSDSELMALFIEKYKAAEAKGQV